MDRITIKSNKKPKTVPASSIKEECNPNIKYHIESFTIVIVSGDDFCRILVNKNANVVLVFKIILL